MTNTHLMRIVALTLMMICVGCGEPVVEITHKYQADLPVPPDTKGVYIGQFTVDGVPAGDIAVATGSALGEELSWTDYSSLPYDPSSQPTSATAVTDKVLYITGKISVTVKDDKGTRKIRLAASGAPLKEVPTLVRNVEVRIVFQLTALPGGKSIGTVETVQRYSSMQDHAVRGENGLLRPDDPANVPSVDVIVRRLIPGCAKTLVSMIQTVDETTRVTLRPATNYMGQEALSLARQKKYAEALTPARVAVGMDNCEAAIFNLAVLSEVTGNYSDALQYYRDAMEMSVQGDFRTIKVAHTYEAFDGIRRIIRIANINIGRAATMPSTAPIEDPIIVPEPPAFMQAATQSADTAPVVAEPADKESPSAAKKRPAVKKPAIVEEPPLVEKPAPAESPKDTSTSEPTTEPTSDLPSLLSPE